MILACRYWAIHVHALAVSYSTFTTERQRKDPLHYVYSIPLKVHSCYTYGIFL
jgi:hypothetical protein